MVKHLIYVSLRYGYLPSRDLELLLILCFLILVVAVVDLKIFLDIPDLRDRSYSFK